MWYYHKLRVEGEDVLFSVVVATNILNFNSASAVKSFTVNKGLGWPRESPLLAPNAWPPLHEDQACAARRLVNTGSTNRLSCSSCSFHTLAWRSSVVYGKFLRTNVSLSPITESVKKHAEGGSEDLYLGLGGSLTCT